MGHASFRSLPQHTLHAKLGQSIFSEFWLFLSKCCDALMLVLSSTIGQAECAERLNVYTIDHSSFLDSRPGGMCGAT